MVSYNFVVLSLPIYTASASSLVVIIIELQFFKSGISSVFTDNTEHDHHAEQYSRKVTIKRKQNCHLRPSP